MYQKYPPQNTQKKSKRLKPRILFALMLALSCLGVWSYFHTSNQESDTFVEARSEPGQEPLAQKAPHSLDALLLPGGIESAIGTLDAGVIKTQESGVPIPMASITKIVTALVVLQKAPLEPGQSGDVIRLEQKDEDYYWKYAAIEGTLTPVTAGYDMTQYEILQAILLPSSNNMADTLVDYYFLDMDEFLQAANTYLREQGLENTRIVDATGFSPESVSIPSDLIKLGQLALQNPVIAEIVAQPRANISVAGEIPNYNILIEEPGVTGIKPGFTDEAGSCLLFSVNLSSPNGPQDTFIAVVMGVKERTLFNASVIDLLNQAKQLYAQLP